MSPRESRPGHCPRRWSALQVPLQPVLPAGRRHREAVQEQSASLPGGSPLQAHEVRQVLPRAVDPVRQRGRRALPGRGVYQPGGISARNRRAVEPAGAAHFGLSHFVGW
uniref:(northern house mosquito) hypothetical protein n=1 Tax=Culex pipiens TaxID=7175 RepID=A0A8D8BZ95_CULPI